jgi:hypothetical protein
MERPGRIAMILGTLVGAAVTLGFLVRPFDGGPAASDANSSVLFFERIASGRTLEAWLNTTPKPLLTVAYGLLHAIDPSWTLVSLSAVFAAAVAVVLSAELARRVAGLPAAAFVAVGLTGSLGLGAEAAWAYGLPGALAFWGAAGLLLLRSRPRPGWSGLCLLFAGLARPETFIVLGIALLILAGAAIRRSPLPPGYWLLMIGWLALPILCLHDLLLTGNPLWWLSVAPHAVELNHGRARSLPGVMVMSANHVRGMWPLAIEAVAGGLILLVRRAWIPVVGLVALGPLVIVYTWALAVRHVNVLSHYYHPADMATVVGAGIAVGAGLAWARTQLAIRNDRAAGSAGRAVVVVAAVVLAVVSSNPFTPLNASARSNLGGQGRLDARVTALLPTLRAALPQRATVPVPAVGPIGSPDPVSVVLFIPRHRLPRMAVDLDLLLTSVAVLEPTRINLAAGYPPVDSVVYMDGLVDAASVGKPTEVLRVSSPTTIGAIELDPILADPARRIWIVAIKRAP